MGFAVALTGLAGNVTLSGGDWSAVKRLAEGVPDLCTGYHPCDLPEARRLLSAGDVDTSPGSTERIAPRRPTRSTSTIV